MSQCTNVRNMYMSRPMPWVLPYMGYMGMCRCEGYGFQAVYSRIGYISQSDWVYKSFFFQETDQLVEGFS